MSNIFTYIAIISLFTIWLHRLLVAIKFKANNYRIFSEDDHAVKLGIALNGVILFFISLPIFLIYKWCMPLSFIFALVLAHFTEEKDVKTMHFNILFWPSFYIDWNDSKIIFIDKIIIAVGGISLVMMVCASALHR